MLDKNEVACLFDTQATELLLEDGAVAGVRCTAGGDSAVEVKAKAVVLCTGGFLGSAELQK